MKRIQRLPLSPEAIAFLLERSQAVAASADPKSEVGRLWSRQNNKAFREIREALRRMAPGLERCMYCEDSHGTAIEHFWPKGRLSGEGLRLAQLPHRLLGLQQQLQAGPVSSGCGGTTSARESYGRRSLGPPQVVSVNRHLSSRSHPKETPSIEVFGLNRATLTMGRVGFLDGASELLLILYARSKTAGGWAGGLEKIEAAVRRASFRRSLLRRCSGSQRVRTRTS